MDPTTVAQTLAAYAQQSGRSDSLLSTPQSLANALYQYASPLPLAADNIDPNQKVLLGRQYRGTGVGQAGNLNSMLGDLGQGVYLTPEEWLGKTYGGGPGGGGEKGGGGVKPCQN